MQIPGLSNDYRTTTATRIFPKYWKGTKTPDIEAVRSVADSLGRTGQYPFSALSAILTDVHAKDPALAEMLFLDALHYYQADKPKSFGHSQFLALLQAAEKIVPDSTIRTAVVAAVSKMLQGAEEPLPEAMIYRGRMASGDGMVELQSPAEESLFRLLPLVRQYVPGLEEQILEKRIGLGRILPSALGTLPRDYSEISTMIEQDPKRRTELRATLADSARSRNVQRFAASDPEFALKVAESIQDPAVKATAFVIIAQGKLKETDPARAAKLIEQAGIGSARRGWDIEPTQNTELAKLVSSARALFPENDPDLWNTLERGLNLAEELFVEEQRNSKTPYINYSGGPDWAGPVFGGPATAFIPAVVLIKIGIEKQTANTLDWLAQQRDPLLKSFLLIAAAEGLWDKRRATPLVFNSPERIVR
jgi:hypothetical protein